MADISAKFSSGLDRIYDQLGGPCTYTPITGSPVEVVATVTYDLSSFGDRDQMHGVTALVSVRRSDLPVEPASGDRYTVDGFEYIVTGIHGASELEHTAAVS